MIGLFPYWFVAAEIGLLFFQITAYLSRSLDKSRLHIILLTLLIVAYNLLNYIVPEQFHILPYQSLIFISSSFFLFVFLTMFQLSEIKTATISSNDFYLYPLGIVAVFSVVLLSCLYLDLYIETSVNIAAASVNAGACYFLVRSISIQRIARRLKTKDLENTSTIRVLLLTSAIINCILPFSTDHSIYLVNSSFFLAYYAFVRHSAERLRIEEKILIKLHTREGQSIEEGLKYSLAFWNISLSGRERDVASMILDGKSYKEIAASLFIEPKTVSKHASNIFRKSGCVSRKEFEQQFFPDYN